MPAYYTLDWPEKAISLNLRPRGLFRTLFKTWIPYLTGDILELELKVKSTVRSSEQFEYTWQLQDLLPSKDFRAVANGQGSFFTKPRGAVKVQMGTHLIQYEAEYHVFFNIIRNQTENSAKTLLNFSAMPKDLYRTRWMIGLMSGFIGAVVGLAAGLLIRGNGS